MVGREHRALHCRAGTGWISGIQNGRDRLSGALAATALASFFLSRYWREAAMKREAERLQLAKSGYADSQLPSPEGPQEPDIEALCAKAAAPTTSPAAKRMCCASSLKGARHRKSPRSSSSLPTP